MKIFSEAVASTIMKAGRVEDGPAVMTELEAVQSRYFPLVEEIQTSEEALAFVGGMMHFAIKQKLSQVELLLLCFSHGVMVGIEMEKPEDK